MHTYKATLRAVALKVTAKLPPLCLNSLRAVALNSRALPMESGGAPYAFFAAAVLLGPMSPSSLSGQLAIRWSYVKLVKAAAAFRHVARGVLSAFDAEWYPQMGVLGRN